KPRAVGSDRCHGEAVQATTAIRAVCELHRVPLPHAVQAEFDPGSSSRSTLLCTGDRRGACLMSVYTYTTLDDPLGINNTLALGVDGSGLIVGEYRDNNGEHGFVDSGGTYTTLNDPSATSGTGASGINATGQIVGSFADNKGTHGFLESGGSYTTLDDPNF